MTFEDFRDYLTYLEKNNDLQRVDGADWNLEMGAITEVMAERGGPALLFDSIKGYTKGFRVATNLCTTPTRTAAVLGIDTTIPKVEMVKQWRDKLKTRKLIPPVQVKKGPVKENILLGDEIDIWKFPSAFWHEQDGGRYFGTGCCVIMKDPETGWINVGTYRVQAFEKNLTGLYMSPGRHGRLIMQKYHSQGKSCPVAVSLGQDPRLIFWSGSAVPKPGESEYDLAGWLKGKPMEVLSGETTALPVPASAEIVIEGEVPPDQRHAEGPFGEWTGYYASGVQDELVIQVSSILHRDDPIIWGAPPMKTVGIFSHAINAGGGIWDVVERAGFDGVRGIWLPTGNNGVVVVSVKTRYPSHARQIGSCIASTMYLGRIVIVVDDDIDITNNEDVLWAVGTRCDPATTIEVMRGMRGSPLDPRLSPEKRKKGDWTLSMAVVDATRPFYWSKDFPPVNHVGSEYREKVLQKWKNLFEPTRQ